MLVAGEPSGDVIGALLIKALSEATAGRLTCFGVGGPGMVAAGLEPLFDQSDLAVMGLVEVVPRLPLLARRLRECVSAGLARAPDIVVTIDSSSFGRRLARRLRRNGLHAPLVHYVAPMVWAWRPGRAARLAREYDHLLTLFPFEPELFRRHGLNAECVGHPVLEVPVGDGAGFRRRHLIDPAAPILLVMPGSRQSEVERLAAPFAEAARRLTVAVPGLRVALPTLPHLAPRLIRLLPEAAVAATESERRDAIAAADAALVASGTATLELAAAGVPMVVGYRAAPLTVWAARRLLRLRHIALPNILTEEVVVPELIQGDCTAGGLATAVAPLLAGGEAAAAQRRGLAEAVGRLGPAGSRPSRRAAAIILSLARPASPPQIDRGAT